MHKHWLAGDAAYSNVAVARACGVDEKAIRQWREGEKPLPAAAVSLLPGVLYDEVLETLASLRGRRPRRAVALLREGVAGLKAQLTNEDPRELRRVLRDVRRELDEIDERLDDVT